jgi:hypothetical protein
MALRSDLAAEQRTWDTQRTQLQREIDILEKESAALEREIARGTGLAASVEEERADLLARTAAMEKELDQLRPVLDRAEAELRDWERRLPQGLRRQMESLFHTLPSSQAEADGTPATRRAQTIAALFTQIEDLQHGFHATRETLEVGDGGRRQVDVLYFGLARAFAVSQDDTWAAIGEPSEGGWAWSPEPAHASAIRGALNVFNREETARLVSLPFQVPREAEP